jgi:sulfate permease, SulP family
MHYKLRSSFLNQFRLNSLLPNLITGLTVGAIGVLFDLSFTALIFSGRLESHLAAGIGLVMFSVAATRIITAFTSSLPGMIADLGTVESAILAWSAGMIAKEIPASVSSTEVFVTVLAAIALTSILTGAFLLILGGLRIGEFVRTMPYPVVGGFIASSGWLLVKGGFKVMTDQPLDLTHLPALLQSDSLLQWFPGLLLAIYLLVLSQRRTHPLAMPASLAVSVGLFYLLLSLTGTSPAQASAQGWTLEIAASQGTWQPLSLAALSQVHWSAIYSQLTCTITVIVVTAIALLMKVTGLELLVDREIDMNRELKVAGLANFVTGLGGGILSYHALSDSMLSYKMGGKTRLSTLAGAAVFIVVPLLGASFLAYFPKPILGGMLLFLGFALLLEWVYDAWFKLSKADYAIVQLISVVSVVIGFLQGLTVGWLLAGILFVIRYSRLYTVRSGVSGSDRPSSVVRSSQERQILHESGAQIYLLEPQGFLFFGTANSLINQVRQRIVDGSPVRFIVLDFSQVIDIDASAVQSFTRLKPLIVKHNLTLVLTQLAPTVRAKFEQADWFNLPDRLEIFADLNKGLAWCEDQILAADLHYFLPEPLRSLEKSLSRKEQLTQFIRYFEPFQLSKRQLKLYPEALPEGMYWVIAGETTVVLELPLQADGLTTASLNSSHLTSQNSDSLDFYYLSQAALKQMQLDDPAIAAELQKLMDHLLIEPSVAIQTLQ